MRQLRIPSVRSLGHFGRAICLAFFAASCASASYKATKEYEKGNFCAFCQLSAASFEADPASRNNMGICFENGLCGYTANRETAVAHYQEAARWDVEEAKQNLRRLGAVVPEPDLRTAQSARNNEIAATIFKAVVLGIAAAASARAPADNSSSANGYNAFARTGCCKKCVFGKPCGDTCIQATDTCHVGVGCACY